MTYQLELSGYGVEIVVGTISKETFNYFLSNNIDMQDFINGNVEIPKELKPFDNGAWFECDDIAHLHNLFFEEKNKLIIKKDESLIHELKLETGSLEELEIEIDYHEFYINEAPDETYRFIGESFEKGTFFSAKIYEEKFEMNQLKIEYYDIEGKEVVSNVFYRGKRLLNEGATTSGQSTEFKLYRSN